MFDSLLHAYEALADKSGIKDYDIRFHGYDGNNETSFMAYAEYFCADDRFTDVVTKGEFNSHFPARAGYQRMLREFNQIPPERWMKMTKEEIQRVIAAR